MPNSINMCKQRTALDVIKHTMRDLPEWFLTHAEAQADDNDAAKERDEAVIAKVDDLKGRVETLETKVDRIEVSSRETHEAVHRIEDTIEELKAVLQRDKIKEKAFVFDKIGAIFKSKHFWIAVLVALSFIAGVSKEAILAVFGIL